MKKIIDWLEDHPALHIITITTLILIIIFGLIFGIYALVTNINKANKKAKIYDVVEEGIYEAYNKQYATEYNLSNITFSIDDVDVETGSGDVEMTVNFDLDKYADERAKSNVCREIDSCIKIPSKMTSKYGGSHDASTYISYYINGELFKEDTFEIRKKEHEQYKREQEEYDTIMGGQDWGDGYYYDSNEHKVKQKLW